MSAWAMTASTADRLKDNGAFMESRCLKKFQPSVATLHGEDQKKLRPLPIHQHAHSRECRPRARMHQPRRSRRGARPPARLRQRAEDDRRDIVALIAANAG